MDTKFRVTVERWHDDERIAVVTADNPPVNAMSIGFPQAIYEAINQAGADPGIELILLTAAGKGMFAGADIKTQGKPWPKGELSLFELIALIDENPKPVAILARVIALGGGLELALACKYRIAEAGTMLGQTEVKLGIPPGAGGTQRLPRLVGVEKALDMVLYGEPIDANEALACGLIDRVVSKSGPVGEAVNYLKAQLDTGKMPLRARDRQVSKHDPSLFASTRQRVGKRSRGETAPLVCIDSVEAATTMSFDDGIAYERARFLECVVSEQAAALRHVFSAERQARKVPGIGKDDTGRPIERAAVLGAGTMGAGIAMCFADAGIPVTVIEREQDALDRGLARVADTYAGQAKKGRIDEAAAAMRTALVAGALGLDAAAASDVVVEAVFEDMDMKKAVFSELSKIAKPDAVLATNTSYLDVNEIAAATNGRDANVLGLHFFSPANIMKLLEVVRGAKTAGDVVVTGLKLGRRLG
ncbi:MAG: 3-hydroxyacyl-CoA dehydrogenase NAD-binding domain-containing protein, partial [Woeseiaceae bacterium]